MKRRLSPLTFHLQYSPHSTLLTRRMHEFRSATHGPNGSHQRLAARGSCKFRCADAAEQKLTSCRYDLSYKYVLGSVLGSGVSADVYQATSIATDEDVAIKVFKDATRAGTHAAATEYLCAMRAASPCALEYHSVAFMNGKPALVMDLASMSLDKWIKVLLADALPIAHAHVSAITGRFLLPSVFKSVFKQAATTTVRNLQRFL